MRFTTRAFLWVFLSFTLILGASFWAVSSGVPFTGVFLSAELTAFLAALGIGLGWSRSIGRPLDSVIAQLQESNKTGELPAFPVAKSGVPEIRELAEGLNHAASAVKTGREELRNANVGFIESLASALDARDPYTAGHSRRVSQYSVAIAEQLNVSEEELDVVRIGALLHDIGKLGISDAILRKPASLTAEEVALIREHAAIGKRILEGVSGFNRFLPVVELHHENWDGSGYPHGLKAEATPLTARIVKVADAYDAMTSDRPYRRGMSHEEALAILRESVGTELDHDVFAAFSRVPDLPAVHVHPHAELQNLADAVEIERGPAQAVREQTLP